MIKDLWYVTMHIPEYAKLVFELLMDDTVMWLYKAVCALAIIYLISPTDIIPDTFFPYGYIEDLIVAYVLMKAFFDNCPLETINQHKDKLGLR